LCGNRFYAIFWTIAICHVEVFHSFTALNNPVPPRPLHVRKL
jgi:hypothetical protein